ncbi:predicted protein [Histoplasma capsulatum var. duboisii H88]|uniref:Predicted protein n=1 Tax=Ajellomyces capsulatus (strain H88) TaxID=544711 RepID=F0UGR8_AJEC8|nr:predicted protein [Histoplasma capsulatum var. duboisii H88]
MAHDFLLLLLLLLLLLHALSYAYPIMHYHSSIPSISETTVYGCRKEAQSRFQCHFSPPGSSDTNESRRRRRERKLIRPCPAEEDSNRTFESCIRQIRVRASGQRLHRARQPSDVVLVQMQQMQQMQGDHGIGARCGVYARFRKAFEHISPSPSPSTKNEVSVSSGPWTTSSTSRRIWRLRIFRDKFGLTAFNGKEEAARIACYLGEPEQPHPTLHSKCLDDEDFPQWNNPAIDPRGRKWEENYPISQVT